MPRYRSARQGRAVAPSASEGSLGAYAPLENTDGLSHRAQAEGLILTAPLMSYEGLFFMLQTVFFRSIIFKQIANFKEKN